MKNPKKNVVLLTVCVVSSSCGLWWIKHVNHSHFNSHYPSGVQMRLENKKRTPTQQKDYVERKRAFAQIWRARHEDDVSSRILPFLNDPEVSLREQATRALGRVESGNALPHLAEVSHRMTAIRKKGKVTAEQWEEIKPIPDYTLDLAIGRIEAREKNGQDKLDCVMQSVGLKWNDLPSITHRAWYVSDGTQPPPPVAATPLEKSLVREIIDVLYEMKAEGQDISTWTKQLSLAPAEELWLSTANMSRPEAVKKLIDYISTLHVVREQDNVLIYSTILTLSDSGLAMVRQKLDYLALNPSSVSEREGTVLLIRGVAYAGDFESIPTLNELSSSKDSYIRSEALQSIKDIKEEKFYLYAPM